MPISLWQHGRMVAVFLICVTALGPVQKVTEVTFPLRAKDNTTMVVNFTQRHATC